MCFIVWKWDSVEENSDFLQTPLVFKDMSAWLWTSNISDSWLTPHYDGIIMCSCYILHIIHYILTFLKGQGYGFAFIHNQEKLLGNPWAINHSRQPSDTFPPFILHLSLIRFNLIFLYFFMHQFQYVWLTTVGIYLMDSQSVLLLPNAIPASYCHLYNSLCWWQQAIINDRNLEYPNGK